MLLVEGNPQTMAGGHLLCSFSDQGGVLHAVLQPAERPGTDWIQAKTELEMGPKLN